MEQKTALERLEHTMSNDFAALVRGWDASPLGEKLRNLEHILAAQRVVSRLSDIIAEDDAASLLTLKKPLEAVADQWLEECGLDHKQDDTLIRCVDVLCGRDAPEAQPETLNGPGTGMTMS